MDILAILNNIFVIVGIPAIVGVLIFLGRKLQLLDMLEKTIREEIKPDFSKMRDNLAGMQVDVAMLTSSVKDLEYKTVQLDGTLEHFTERVTALEGKEKDAFFQNSPLQLSDKGMRVIDEAGLKAFVDDNLSELIKEFKSDYQDIVFDNPYDLEQAAFDFIDEYDDYSEDLEVQTKTVAFNEGMSLEVVLRSTGIYFRDILMKEFGMSTEYLEKQP